MSPRWRINMVEKLCRNPGGGDGHQRPKQLHGYSLNSLAHHSRNVLNPSPSHRNKLGTLYFSSLREAMLKIVQNLSLNPQEYAASQLSRWGRQPPDRMEHL